jgi:hypothetical protein
MVLSELTHLMHKFQYKFDELTSQQTPSINEQISNLKSQNSEPENLAISSLHCFNK